MTDRGSATIVMTAVAAILAVCLVATGSLGVIYAARSQAALAADAAALAAAVATYPTMARGSPVAEASRAAADNGATLTACACLVDPGLRPRTVTVRAVVTLRVPVFGRLAVAASSRAEFDPKAWLGH